MDTYAAEASAAYVSRQHPHTKLLSEAARQLLRPLGLIQKGRSRTWLDDRGWWLGVVEFQPSSWSRGSYLNVGVNWLWTPKDDLSYDFGGRLGVPGDGGYVEYKSDEQFWPLAVKLATIACDDVRRLRELFPTIEAAAAVLEKATDLNIEESIDAGIALALVGEGDRARTMLRRHTEWFESDEDLEWRVDEDRDLYERVRALIELTQDRTQFREQIRRDVRQARSLLKLDPDADVPL
jgi:hypothetical protein